MNLVGYTSLQTGRPLSVFIGSPVYEVATKNGAGYIIATLYGSGWFSPTGLSTLEPGKGYFVKASTAGTWSYSS
jgi:hypothetical protein